MRLFRRARTKEREAALEASIGALTERLDALTGRVEALGRLAHQVHLTEHARAAGEQHMHALGGVVDEHRRLHQVRAVMDWIVRVEPRSQPLVSVVLPTRDRVELLPRAIASVRAQSYKAWELVIVDDGSHDGTPGFLAGVQNPAIRSVRTDGRGVCAARNLALAQASGDLIAYLDDDNIMHPEWLKSVVWGFEQHPQAQVLYGAFIVDDTARIDRKGQGDLPRLYFHPYDHHSVAMHNIADIGCIAHRARLAEAHFDETLREMGDWDLLLRLTRRAPPLALPAIACYYTTDAPGRLSGGPTHEADMAKVREKNRR